MRPLGKDPDPATLARTVIAPDFVTQVNQALRPGATLIVTDQPLSTQDSGSPLQGVDADPPAAKVAR